MRSYPRLSIVIGAALCVGGLLMPITSSATLLWGHPYALQSNENNMGWAHMWNDLNPGTPYVGTATFPTIDFMPGSQNMWDMLVQGMVNKKLSAVWTNAGPDANYNDGSTGVIRACVVTIFGN